MGERISIVAPNIIPSRALVSISRSIPSSSTHNQQVSLGIWGPDLQGLKGFRLWFRIPDLACRVELTLSVQDLVVSQNKGTPI